MVSRNVEINLNGAPGVVCQLADHTQGTEETIEVTVVPRRRPGKLIVRVDEDESGEDSLASPKVVVTTTRSDSRQEGRRHRHHRSCGRNDENVAPTGNNQNDDEEDDDDDDKESLRVNTGRNKTPATAERKTGAKRPSYTEEQNAPSKYTSSAGPSHPAHDRVYKADHLPPPPPGSAATGHSSTAPSHRLSAPIDFARRRLNKLAAPLKSFSRAANSQPVDREKTRDTGNHHRESYRDSYRHSNGKRKGDHDHDHGHHHHHRSTRARSSANPSPTTESFGTSTPGSYLDDFEHRCHSCGKPRCGYIQNERPVREGEKVKPSLCSSCQSKLGSSRHKILGPDGRDLSQRYWCDTCGFLRSTRYHIANGFPDDESRQKEVNMCSWCTRAEKRRDEKEERERQIEDIQAKLTVCPEAIALAIELGGRLTVKCVQKKNTKLNETIGQPPPPPASSSIRSSSYGSYLAPPPRQRQRPQYDDKMGIDDSDNAYHAHNKGIDTTSTMRASSFSSASIRSQRGPTSFASIAPPQRVATPVPTHQPIVEDAPPSPEDTNGGGFINNPSAFWAKVGDDPMLRACFEQDPREAAARRARLAGNYQGPSITGDDDDDDDYTSSIAQGESCCTDGEQPSGGVFRGIRSLTGMCFLRKI